MEMPAPCVTPSLQSGSPSDIAHEASQYLALINAQAINTCDLIDIQEAIFELQGSLHDEQHVDQVIQDLFPGRVLKAKAAEYRVRALNGLLVAGCLDRWAVCDGAGTYHFDAWILKVAATAPLVMSPVLSAVFDGVEFAQRLLDHAPVGGRA